jgi:Ca-activated chloride channel family protein
MTFLDPMWLWALLVVPVLVVIAVRWERDRAKVGQAFADPAVMAIGSDATARRLRRIALALAILAAAMGPVALARPAISSIDEKQQGAVVLGIDTSKSMTKTDLQPSRLDAAKQAANEFLDSAPEDVMVGLVTFNDRAVVQVAPTLDRQAVRTALGTLQVREGTALGDAVIAGIGSLEGAGVLTPVAATPQQSAGRIMILTDGAGNVGTSTDDDIARLTDLVAQTRDALVRGGLSEAHALNSEFHDEVTRIADNPFLRTALEPLQGSREAQAGLARS